MKLKTKLTALCAALLFAVAVSLTAAMLCRCGSSPMKPFCKARRKP